MRISNVLKCGAVLLMAAFLTGCPEENVVPPPVPGPNGLNPMMPPVPGGVQVGVTDPLNGEAPKMNANALAFYQQGMTSWANGDLKAAMAAFTQATQADPGAFQAYYSLGVVQERLGSNAALASYKKAYEIVPTYDRAMVAYGVLLGKNGDYANAESFLRKQRGKLPKSAPLAAALAEVMSLKGDSATAQEMAQEALKLDPTYAPAMMAIARDHYRARRLDSALMALKAVLDGLGGDNPARDKDNAEGYLLRAFIMSEQEHRVEAMENFRKALELRPDLVVARIRLATYLLESGGATEALPMLQQAIKYDSDNVAAHLALGDAYRLTGDFSKAKNEFDWVKGKDANMPEVHYNLGLLYLFAPKGAIQGMKEKQQIEAAIASFTKFKELKSKSGGGDVEELLKQANYKKAEIEAIEQAKQPQPVVPAPAPDPAAAQPQPAG
jgi:Tfp pilus assembly protein PilF